MDILDIFQPTESLQNKLDAIEADLQSADENNIGAQKATELFEKYGMLFDDFLFDDFLESSDIGLSDEQKYLGNKLRDSLNTYSPPGSTLPPPEQMLDDPEWQKVRNIAREFVDSLEQPGT